MTREIDLKEMEQVELKEAMSSFSNKASERRKELIGKMKELDLTDDQSEKIEQIILDAFFDGQNILNEFSNQEFRIKNKYYLLNNRNISAV